MEKESVTLTPADLLRISPDVRKLMQDATALRRTPVAAIAPATTGGGSPRLGPAPASPRIEEIPDSEDRLHASSSIPRNYLPPAESLAAQQPRPNGVYPVAKGVYRVNMIGAVGARVSADANADVIVASNSFKLRSIATWVNDVDIVECILDSGSQIVSCSVDKAHELGLSWDPTARITMMSANGEEQSTLGLARDVPVAISGGITVYLQMHIVQNTSYDVLLGRPFEVLLSAEIRNEADGRQTLEVTCPNTGKRIAMPTYAKGTAPAGMREIPMGFRRSRM